MHRARQSVLEWYDRHGRDLPWRVKKGQQDPYKVWLSEIMLQQTTVMAVAPYYKKFIDIWPNVTALANADDDAVMQAWAGLGYYSRARNLLKCARVIRDDFQGVFPEDEKILLSLPGVGAYTAAAICSIAFNKPTIVVDGNIERIASRVFDIATPMPALKNEVKQAIGPMMQIDDGRQSDFVQAMMDIGASICTPKAPKCMLCPLQAGCRTTMPEGRPVKAIKKAKPHRKGRVFIIRNDHGHIAVEKRDEDIMLGGMWGLPSTTWHDKARPDHLPHHFDDIRETGLSIRHIFTHFSLELQVMEATSHDDWHYADTDDIRFPTLYHKVVRLT